MSTLYERLKNEAIVATKAKIDAFSDVEDYVDDATSELSRATDFGLTSIEDLITLIRERPEFFEASRLRIGDLLGNAIYEEAVAEIEEYAESVAQQRSASASASFR